MNSNDPIQHLLDKQAITELIQRRARAADRRDVALALSCYHDGTTEDQDGYSGSAEGFLWHGWNSESPITRMWHGIISVNIELRGDEAAAETYVLAFADISKDGCDYDAVMGARYLDNLARVDGRWGIVHRRQLYDYSRVDRSGDKFWEFLGQRQEGMLFGTFGEHDLSYELFRSGPSA